MISSTSGLSADSLLEAFSTFASVKNFREEFMEIAVTGLIAIFLFAYLVFAMLYPEKF